MRRLVLPESGVVAAAVLLLLLGASAAASTGSGQALHVKSGSAVATGSAPARGLLVIEGYEPSGAIVSLAGKRLPVPARVRTSPFGLSPDARRVADTTADGVRVGAVRGGSMTTVLRGNCPRCMVGTNPSYAWSPDSRRLAVAAEPLGGPTLLKLAGQDGRIVQSFRLPRTRPGEGRVYHRLVSWSPDGSRLLLIQSSEWVERGAVLDLESGSLRTLTPDYSVYLDSPQLAWSPDGRFVAVTSTGVQDAMDKFDVVDASTARPVIHRSAGKWDMAEAQSPPVWAPDSRSLFVAVFSSHPRTGQPPTRIVRLSLTGRRTQVIGTSAERLIPRVALSTGLVYSTRPIRGAEVLHLFDFATGHRDSLTSSRGIAAVLPLARIP